MNKHPSSLVPPYSLFAPGLNLAEKTEPGFVSEKNGENSVQIFRIHPRETKAHE